MLGWTVERGAIRREVEAIAFETEYYVEKRLLALETKFKNLIPPKRRSGWNRVKRRIRWLSDSDWELALK